MGQTTRYALPYPELTDPADVPADIKKLADKVDSTFPSDTQGTPVGSRPAPGHSGAYWTDTATGVTYRDDGTKWVALNEPSLLAPTGAVQMFAGTTAPAGWLLCNGGSYQRADYPALSAMLLAAGWGFPDANTFVVPDMRGSAPVGVGQGPGLTTRPLASKGGAEAVALAVSEMPSHAHGGVTGSDSPDHSHSGQTGLVSSDHTHHINFGAAGAQLGAYGPFALAGVQGIPGGSISTFPVDTGGISANHSHAFGTGGASARHTHVVTAQGGGGAHSNMQPFVALNFIIKT